MTSKSFLHFSMALVTAMAMAFIGKAEAQDGKLLCMGKLLIGNVDVIPLLDDGAETLESFSRTNLELLESPEIKKKAAQLTLASHPSIKESRVVVHVFRDKSSRILNIFVEGDEPEYMQAFLNGVLHAFIEFRKELWSKRHEAQLEARKRQLTELKTKLDEVVKSVGDKPESQETKEQVARARRDVDLTYDELIKWEAECAGYFDPIEVLEWSSKVTKVPNQR